MAKNWTSPKDPDERVDYKVNWAEDEDGNPGRAAGDPITASTWTVPDGVTTDEDSFDDETTTIWFTGGTAGAKYSCVNRITTEGGRIYEQTCVLKIKTR